MLFFWGMKKFLLIIVLAVLVVFFINNRNNSSETEVSNDSVQGEETVENQEVSNEENVDDEEEGMKALSGEAGYVAQKVYFNQPGEEVTGVSPDVAGDISYTENQLLADISVSTENLESGNGTRDQEVRDLIGESIEAQIVESDIELPFSGELPVTITINNVSNQIPFVLNVTNEDMLSIDGSGTISLEAFNLEPFGAPGIYSVENDIELFVEVSEL